MPFFFFSVEGDTRLFKDDFRNVEVAGFLAYLDS